MATKMLVIISFTVPVNLRTGCFCERWLYVVQEGSNLKLGHHKCQQNAHLLCNIEAEWAEKTEDLVHCLISCCVDGAY